MVYSAVFVAKLPAAGRMTPAPGRLYAPETRNSR